MQNIVIIGVTSGKIKKEKACAECANAKWKKKGLARGAQGCFEIKSGLRSVHKGVSERKRGCAACARMFENEKAFARSAQGSREIKTLFNSKKSTVKKQFPIKKVWSIQKRALPLHPREPAKPLHDAQMCGSFFLYDEQQNPISETIRPMLPNRMTGSWITLPTDALRIYFNLCIIKYFLNIISPNNDMKSKVNALLAAYPSIDISAMGFPRGWESEPLWQ